MNKAFEKILERLEEFERRLLNESGDIGCTLGITNMSEYSKQVVQEVAQEYNGGWIPCSDKLPENNKEVLCYAKSTAGGGDVMFTGSQDNGCWFLQTAADTKSYPNQYKVIAWQPLPEPYKESEVRS